MALPQSLPRLTRLARLALSPRARAASDVSPTPRDSCNPTPAPPCPPCVPVPRPPCRGRAAERVQALRVTCCPPPRGMRPPCAPPLSACALDCTQARPTKERNMTASCVLYKNCDEKLDRVAARLAASKEWRRQEYMREVRERRPPPPPRNAPYRLPAERECARASDGRTYTIADSPPEPPAGPITVSRACGPCREPPPPKCIEIIPDNKCQIRGPGYVDHCAHKPRVIVSIDRSKTRDTNAPASKSSACNQHASAGGITSRIMKSFNLNKGEGGESSSNSATRPSAKTKGPAQYAGDTGWCGKVQPVAAPTRCRPPTQEERLQRRVCRDIPCGQQTKPPHARNLHTSAATSAKEAPKDMKSMVAKTKANMEKLEKMLANRASYKEAAKGRVVDCVLKVDSPATGGLELPVPPGAATIRVNVSLDPAKNACSPGPNRTPPICTPAGSPKAPSSSPCGYNTVKTTPCAARAAANTCGVSPAVSSSFNASTTKCLSRKVSAGKTCEPSFIKTLQKKISDTCRLTETTSKDPCTNPCQPKPSPCGPPPKPSKPTPSRSPCPPPKAPTKKSDCDKKKKKPACFTPAFSTQVDVCN
ncbi:hypothetical protein O0L34_g3742 [Tuta absoluta]|nr:hypothetical protein O0L34_g3742 [Tuta absoluta]